VTNIDPQLRARITALSDPELARMLTLDADNYRDEALVFGREEAARRNLDLAVAASEAEWGSHGSVAARKTTSTELLAPLPAKRLARPYVAIVVIGILFLFDIGLWAGHSVKPDQRLGAIVLVNLIGLWEYLRVVRRLHVAIQVATGWKYPVTPAFSVVAHFIPFYNLYFICTWPARVAAVGSKEGHEHPLDVLLPCALNLLGLVLGWFAVSIRFAPWFLSVWYVQSRLVRRTAGMGEPEAVGGDWSSSARI